MKIALTLYTVRDLLAEDFRGTLERIAEIGYRTCQISGLPPELDADLVRQTLDTLGLRALAPHVGLNLLERRLPKVIEDAKTLGCEDVILPWVSPNEYADGWRAFARRLSLIAEGLRAAGLGFGYHNHSFEFALENGRPGFDVLWENTDPALVKAEVDVYWAEHGGADPAATIRKLKGRIPWVHCKDMSKDQSRTFEEVGAGILDWDGILAACAEAGTEWAVVELDTCPRHPLESIRASREFLLGKGLVD